MKYDEWVKSKKQKFDKAVADKKAADKEKAYKAMLEAQTNYDSNGKPITFEQHIKSLLDNGYTDIEVSRTRPSQPTTLIKYENGKGRITLKSQVFRKKIEQEYVQKMQAQHSEKIIAEDIAREEKDRAENPDKYLSDEETEHLFNGPSGVKQPTIQAGDKSTDLKDHFKKESPCIRTQFQEHSGSQEDGQGRVRSRCASRGALRLKILTRPWSPQPVEVARDIVKQKVEPKAEIFDRPG